MGYNIGCAFFLRHTPLYDDKKDKIWPLYRLLFLPIISSLHFSVIKNAQLQIWIEKATLEIGGTGEHNFVILGTTVYSYYDFLQARTCETCLGINQHLRKVTHKTVWNCGRFLIGYNEWNTVEPNTPIITWVNDRFPTIKFSPLEQTPTASSKKYLWSGIWMKWHSRRHSNQVLPGKTRTYLWAFPWTPTFQGCHYFLLSFRLWNLLNVRNEQVSFFFDEWLSQYRFAGKQLARLLECKDTGNTVANFLF